MEKLVKLFKSKPSFGWGDESEYTGNVQDISEAVSILSGEASMSIIFSRSQHLKEVEGCDVDIIPYKIWIESIKEEETYRGYMLRKYRMKDGEFVLNISEAELNELAGIMFKYFKK